MNKQRKNNVDLVQNCAISRNLSKQETRNTVTNFLQKLKKVDPERNREKEQLLRAIKGLNTQFDINYSFEPKTAKPVKKVRKLKNEDESYMDLF